MPRLFLVWVLFAFTTKVLAQSTPKMDLYAMALAEAAKGSGEKEVVVAKSESVAANYPDRLDDIHVQVLTDDQLIARSKATKRDFYVLKVRPAEAVGALVEIPVIRYSFSGSSGRRISIHRGIFLAKQLTLKYGLSDWCNVYFGVDPVSQEFRVVKVETGGI